MKKNLFLWMVMALVSLFAACSDDDDDPAQSPVTVSGMPGKAAIGQVYTLSGTGFTADASLFLADEAGRETAVENPEFSATGAQFRIPTSLQPGKYTLILKQKGTWTIGTITLSEMECPVTDLSYPSELLIGQTLFLGGTGFNATSKVYLEDADGNRTALEVLGYNDGLSCKVPADLQSKALYTLIFAQDGGEWKAEKPLTALVAKRLKSIQQVIPGGGWDDVTESPVDLLQTKTFIYENNQLTKIQQGSVRKDNEETQEETADYLTFERTGNTIKAVSDEEDYYSYTVDGNRISNCIIIEWGEESANHAWTYDEGYLKTIGKADDEAWGFEYNADNNLRKINQYGSAQEFDYGQDRALGIDLAKQLTATEDVLCAMWLGLDGKRSGNVPTTWYTPGEDAPETIELSYELDADGYVVKVSYKMPWDENPTEITFEYEKF